MDSVLGFLGDYGIGNSMERGSAERSATQRLRQLQDLRASKGCSGTYLSTADRSAAAASDVNSSAAHLPEDPSDTPGTIQLSPRVKLVPARTLSGYCIKAALGYTGTGSVSSPVATKARRMCS